MAPDSDTPKRVTDTNVVALSATEQNNANLYHATLTPGYTPGYTGYTYPLWPAFSYVYQCYPPTRCVWCQGYHYEKCPRLKLVVYRDDGTLERVEFFPA